MGKRRAKGTGYLIDNPDGTKTLRQSIKDPRTGRIKRIQVTAATETACNRQMKKRLAEIELKYPTLANTSVTVTGLCEDYTRIHYEQGLIKRSSKDRNEVTISNQIEPYLLGHLQAATVTSKDIDNHFATLMAENKLSVSSIEKVKYVLDAAFTWAVRRGDLYMNPLDPVRESLSVSFARRKSKGADDEDVRILTDEEERKIIETAYERLQNGDYRYPGGIHARFLLATGLRVGEYISLKWKDYDRKNHILRVNKSRHQVKSGSSDTGETRYITEEGTTKNSKARNLELMENAIEVIEELYRITPWNNPDDYICLTRNKKNYTATSMEHIIGTVYKNAGVSDTVSGLHIFRRTLATKLFREGYSIKEVAAYLGDEEATVSRYYVAARETREVDGRRIAVVSLKKR